MTTTREIEAQTILCDAAQADPSGKISMLGAGWTWIKPPYRHAVAVLIKIPWDRANERLPLVLRLLTEDGQAVRVLSPSGEDRPIESTGTVEVGRPPGTKPGSTLNAAFALNVPALPLTAGRYTWRLEIADLVREESFNAI